MTPTEKEALVRAQGYLDLGMLGDAWGELGAVALDRQQLPPALHVKVPLLMKEQRWEEALDASRLLCRYEPEGRAGFIHAAFCLHELGRTVEARKLLLDGPDSLRDDPVYHYNLSCYQVCLGEYEDAQRLLQRSFELDERLVPIAENDPDLSKLWSSL